jgi:hypothetical protein
MAKTGKGSQALRQPPRAAPTINRVAREINHPPAFDAKSLIGSVQVSEGRRRGKYTENA